MIRSWNDAFFITIGFPKQKLLKSQPSINDKKKKSEIITSISCQIIADLKNQKIERTR